MSNAKQLYYEKRAERLVKNLRTRHFDACYCATAEQALEAALALIPEGSSVAWGGALSAQQIGLMDAVREGNYIALDRDRCPPEERNAMMARAFSADVFLTGANAISLDGQMVNIDGLGNRVAAIIYGPKKVIVIAGMNKVCDTLEDAVRRARTVAAPMNEQRFLADTPCAKTGICGDCKSESCICNHMVITRHCRPVNRIHFILVGEELGF
ncbi:MAG: lactate utilization protein [Oscillospiraceae bacterium]|nr:lactate utilization protein [Oscillospiraceae bacterium]